MPVAKNKKKEKVSSKKIEVNKEVIILKMIILFAILLIPLVVIILNMNKQALVLKYKEFKGADKIIETNLNKPKWQDFNFEAPIPAERNGNLANVSQEKIDSLFDNLKE